MSVFRNTVQGSSAPFIPVRLYLIDFFDGDINTALFVERLQFLLSCTDDPRGTYQSREGWYAQTRLTPRQIDSVRKRLRDKRYLIETHDKRNHKVYYRLDEKALDADFAPFSKAYFSKNREINFTNDGVPVAPKLDLSRVEKAPRRHLHKTQQPIAQNATATYTKRKPLITEEDTEEDTEEIVRSPKLPRSFDSVSSAMEEVKKRVTRRRAEKAAPAKSSAIRRHSQKTIQAAWQEAMLEHHPGVYVVPSSPAELVKMQGALKGILATATLHEVFSFFAEYWTVLRSTKFKWLTEKGQTLSNAPSLSELLRYWRVFAKAFADRQAIKAEQAAKAVVTEEDKLKEDNRRLAAELARKDAENTQLRKRLRVSDQIASGLSRKKEQGPEKPKKTLGERRAALSDELPDADIPHWKDSKR